MAAVQADWQTANPAVQEAASSSSGGRSQYRATRRRTSFRTRMECRDSQAAAKASSSVVIVAQVGNRQSSRFLANESRVPPYPWCDRSSATPGRHQRAAGGFCPARQAHRKLTGSARRISFCTSRLAIGASARQPTWLDLQSLREAESRQLTDHPLQRGSLHRTERE